VARAREGFSTRSVHAGETRDAGDALDAPLVLSSTFALGTADEAAAAFRGEKARYVYGRWQNPSVEQLEQKLAALESGEDAVAAASGMAAVTGALLASLRSGDHVVAPVSCYGETSRLLRERLPAFGMETSFVDAGDPSAYERAIRQETRVLYLETPANPLLHITDIARVAELARGRELCVIVDNTFATPFAQQPLLHGADLVLHSLTKGLGGHGDAIGGIVCGGRERVRQVRELVVKGFGGVLAPFNALLISRGIRTLALRQSAACASALEIARWLEAHPAVSRVHYPGLESHPGHAVAARQMRAFGALLSFELHGGLEAARAVIDRVELVTHAVSLGDIRSLIVHPASTTAANIPPAVRAEGGITDGLIRLSVGIEDTVDLISDLSQALGT